MKRWKAGRMQQDMFFVDEPSKTEEAYKGPASSPRTTNGNRSLAITH